MGQEITRNTHDRCGEIRIFRPSLDDRLPFDERLGTRHSNTGSHSGRGGWSIPANSPAYVVARIVLVLLSGQHLGNSNHIFARSKVVPVAIDYSARSPEIDLISPTWS